MDTFETTQSPYSHIYNSIVFKIYRYDLLFGLTEIESFNSINAIGITHGLLDSERDGYLRFYMQNRFEFRPNIAMELALREYSNIYTNTKKPQPGEHRDVVLEILSDARVAAPLLQTGIYHSRVNPSTYMYLFSHISKAGDYPNVSFLSLCMNIFIFCTLCRNFFPILIQPWEMLYL